MHGHLRGGCSGRRSRSPYRGHTRAHGAHQGGSGVRADKRDGPLISREHRDRVAGHLSTAVEEGATLAVDGRADSAVQSSGFFLGPSLIDNAKPGMRCYDTEIFGPVLSVVRVATYAEGLRLINENPYGNGTAIFTQNGGAAHQFQFDVEVGMVGINVPIPVPVSYYSFGDEIVALRRPAHVRPGGRAVLYALKGCNEPLARSGASKVDLGFRRFAERAGCILTSNTALCAKAQQQ